MTRRPEKTPFARFLPSSGVTSRNTRLPAGTGSGSAVGKETIRAEPDAYEGAVDIVRADPARSRELNWNRLLDKAIRVAPKVLNDPKKVTTLLHINAVVGQKEDQGYRFLSDTGISVQGQDANGAWRAVYRIAKELSIPFDVEFMWLQKEGVAYAGQTGRFASN